MKNKYKIARLVNAIICIGISLSIMSAAYQEWIKYGEYGGLQFISSLVYHGGLGVIIYFVIDYILRKLFNRN